jgi:hypothetical protein
LGFPDLVPDADFDAILLMALRGVPAIFFAGFAGFPDAFFAIAHSTFRQRL